MKKQKDWNRVLNKYSTKKYTKKQVKCIKGEFDFNGKTIRTKKRIYKDLTIIAVFTVLFM